MKRQFTVTVGIPTCYGGKSLVATVKSLRASVNVPNFRLIVVADRTPIKPKIKKQLTDLGVELYWNDIPGAQTKKLIQMVPMLKTDVFVYTQDDIIFAPETVSEILKSFQHDRDLTMISTSILPLPPKTYFESIMARMLYIVRGIAMSWAKGDNHLSASGRCLAFRVPTLKQYKLVDGLVNCDMFEYLENKRVGGKFRLLYDSKVYIRCTQSLKEQMKPSSKYQYSHQELHDYFDYDISDEYVIPFWAIVKGFGGQIVSHPFTSTLYVGVFIYTRVFMLAASIALNPLLRVELSTKKLA